MLREVAAYLVVCTWLVVPLYLDHTSTPGTQTLERTLEILWLIVLLKIAERICYGKSPR